MNYTHWTACLLSGALAACGGSSDGGYSLLSGQVLTANGAAVAASEVVLMNRLTDEKFDARTDDKGRYELRLPNGAYDIMAVDADFRQAQGISLLQLNGGAKQQSFQLPAQGSSDDERNRVSGQLFLPSGEPAANHRMVFSSTVGHGDQAPLWSVETQSDAQGHFAIVTDGARHFDLDVYAPGAASSDAPLEFIDFLKLDGALSLEVHLGTDEVANVYRHNQSAALAQAQTVAPAADLPPPTPFVVSISDVGPALGGGEGLPSMQASLHFQQGATPPGTATEGTPFVLTASPSEADQSAASQAVGLIKEDDQSFVQNVAKMVGTHVLSDDERSIQVTVRDGGSWSYKYSVHVQKLKSEDYKKNLVSDQEWTFVSKGNESSTLWVESWGDHRVSYSWNTVDDDAATITDARVATSFGLASP